MGGMAGFLSEEKARRKKNEAYPMLVSFIGNLKIIFLTLIPLHHSPKFWLNSPFLGRLWKEKRRSNFAINSPSTTHIPSPYHVIHLHTQLANLALIS